MIAVTCRIAPTCGRYLYILHVFVWIHLFTTTGPLSARQIVDLEREYKVKAVFLYSFGRFTTWPEQLKTESFTVGVIGKSRIIDSLERIARKRSVNGIPIEIRNYTAAERIDDDCHILFVAKSVDPRDATQLLAQLADRPVLTVTETARHRESGSVINFTLDEESVHFEINIDAANRKQLSLDARLLRQGRQMSL